MTDDTTLDAVLSCPMQDNDAGASTVQEYLIRLGLAVWEEEEGFSGKRPFGNSGWQGEVLQALAKAGLVASASDPDEDYWFDITDERAARRLVAEAGQRLLRNGQARALREGDVLGRSYDQNIHPPGHPEFDPDNIGYDGFCGGEFGRDSYEIKRVERIGHDYVICRTKDGRAESYTGNPQDLVQYVLPREAWERAL